ncbi:DUF1684 domain-containing protein [Mangrovimonas sp. DI 80]|uniref:DUF1684 domain-containing protein n=1 Tax=Mangrovimonas sp. DI 80 TaxID=1779330 RepID=UPI0009764EB3|nr:DUF1684 domain-containing protein [Mangrovimonas sp. DI 80]OMP30363.1 hypothetical protein BKM32_13355 [Mangrovimonas sp. DI 80]
MRFLIFLFLGIFALGCAQDKQPILGETAFQKKLNAEFRDATMSPLTDEDRKDFKGLSFFEVDSSYVVSATLHRTPDSLWFLMKTTTDRESKERVYGVLKFELKGTSYELKVYQGEELMTQEGFEDYLFLPFLDNTNGDESYGGGRYIDLRIPEGDSLTIDFNKAYNPYCAYNARYSCPIVPRDNYLNTEIKAGVKAYKKK